MSVASVSRTAERTGYWNRTLGYSHAWATVVLSLGVGVAFHFFIGYRSTPLPMVALLAGVLAFMVIAGRIYRTNRVVHWLTGIPFAVVTTTVVALLALIGGVVPEATLQQKVGVQNVWSSWPFLLPMTLMLITLVGTVGKRCWPLTYTNIVFLSSHAGLAIAIIGGAVSALTIDRRTVVLFEGMPTATAQAADGSEIKLPFQLTLRKFILETFPPTLAWAQSNEKEKDGLDIEPGSKFVSINSTETLRDVRVEVLRYYPKAVLAGDTWREVPWNTAAPAALVRATRKGQKPIEGWVSCGGIETSGALLQLDDKTAIVMPEPRPKKFRSEVDVVVDGKAERKSVEVNKKLSLAGYDLYQVSYDDKMGAASQYSVLEAVRDRGLPVVYAGIFIMLLGCLLHLGNGIGGKR